MSRAARIKVYTRRIEGHSALVYTYWASRDCGFRFHLMSEVGQPWYQDAKDKAQALARRRGGVVKQIELDASPWVVDAIVKERTA